MRAFARRLLLLAMNSLTTRVFVNSKGFLGIRIGYFSCWVKKEKLTTKSVMTEIAERTAYCGFWSMVLIYAVILNNCRWCDDGFKSFAAVLYTYTIHQAYKKTKIDTTCSRSVLGLNPHFTGALRRESRLWVSE